MWHGTVTCAGPVSSWVTQKLPAWQRDGRRSPGEQRPMRSGPRAPSTMQYPKPVTTTWHRVPGGETSVGRDRKPGLAVAVLPGGVSCPRGPVVCGPEVVGPEQEPSQQETQHKAPSEVSHACRLLCLGTSCQGATILTGNCPGSPRHEGTLWPRGPLSLPWGAPAQY